MFFHKGDSEVHMISHTGEKDHLCDRCGKSFNHICNIMTYLPEIRIVGVWTDFRIYGFYFDIFRIDLFHKD